MIAGIMPRVEAQAATTPAKVTEEQVKQRMETIKKFAGKYFTVNGKACCRGCYDGCGTRGLIKSGSYIKNYLDILPTSYANLPKTSLTSNLCASCRAFATIVHWYLYAQKSTDEVKVNILYKNVKLSANYIDKLKTGDIIEFEGHSMIYIEPYTKSGAVIGVKVIESNIGSSKYGHNYTMIQNWSFSGLYSDYGNATICRATNYSDHVHDYSGDNNIGYCNSCKNDYLTTSAFSSSKVYTSGTVTPKTTAQLHVKMRPYAASTWTNGDANIKANSATMEYTCKNHWGHTWYCVKFKDSSGSYKTGYVYNGDVNFEKNPNTVSASCYLASRFGGKINEGDSLWVSKSEYGGSVKSTDGTTKLSKVVFGIYNTNGSLTSSKNEVTKTNINATSYTISSSDDTILFSSLSQGSYVFKITGYDVNGKQGSASFNFAVVKSGTTTYTVSYNANGGSGAPSSQTKIKDTTLKLSTQKPTRSGHTFLGWATSSSATSAQYQPGGSYTNNASVTLYAVWQKNAPVTYTVSYNANGGSGAPSSQTKTHGTTLTLSTQKPTRSGHTFLGWATSSSATSAQYQPGGSYTSNSSVTLYAVWKAQTYTVSYNANGGSGAPSSQTKTHDVTLTLSAQQPTRDGYTFLGWSTSASIGPARYWPGTSYFDNANITLYALWTYHISYNSNGGTIILMNEDDCTAIQYNELVASTVIGGDRGVKIKSVIRDGYTFIGWSTDSNATTAQYQNGDVYNKNVDIDLYAVWQKDATKNRLPGDVNGDGKVDSRDAIRLSKYLAKMDVEINLENADVTGDGRVDTRDLIRLKKYLAKMPVELV